MYDGNPGEIDFGSSTCKCEVQVGDGLSYQQWTAQFIYSDLAGKIEASAIIIIILLSFFELTTLTNVDANYTLSR